jgi:hypothetical protein
MLDKLTRLSHDNLARLLTATGIGASMGIWQRRFAYDRWGNRTGMWDATSGGNQLQSISIAMSNGVANNRIDSVNGITL